MINIATTTDSDFADTLMTSLVSLLENNLDKTFQFFIINDKLTQDDKDYLGQLKKIYSNIKKIEFVQVNTNYYKKANINSPGTAIKENTYYRIELPLILPVSKLLYMDADMITIGDISGLWNTDLYHKPAGAIQEADFIHGNPRLDDLHIKDKANGYFNGGLILIDVKQWNKQHITQKAHRFIAQHGSDLTYQDQDALNKVLDGNWQHLHPKYNLEPYLLTQSNPDPIRDKLRRQAIQSPIILHFTGWGKPWVRTGKWVNPWRNKFYWYKYIATMRLHDYKISQINVTNAKIKK